MKRLNEDNINSAIDSLKYSRSMYLNAKENNLDSINYWLERVNSAKSRIKYLQQKGERFDKGLINNQNLSFKDILKSNKQKQIAKIFKKELIGALTYKNIYDHSKHLIKKLNNNLEISYNKFKENPKQSINELGKQTINFFKDASRGTLHLKQIGNNLIDSSKELYNKHKTKFTEEEKEAMKSDPDMFFKSLGNKLTEKELKEFKRLRQTVFYSALALSVGTHVVSTGINSSQFIFNTLTNPEVLENISVEVLKESHEKIGSHLLTSINAAFQNTLWSVGEKVLAESAGLDEKTIGLLVYNTFPITNLLLKNRNILNKALLKL